MIKNALEKIQQAWWVIGLIIVTLVLALINQQWAQENLYFFRQAIDSGQWWMVWTGNLCHATFYHWAMNMALIAVLSYFFIEQTDKLHLVGVLFVMMPVVGLGLYFLNPELDIYTGFSGVVQGWLSCVLIRSLPETPKFNIAILALQWGRIVYEQMPGYDVNYMRNLIDAAVAVDAHLYGAIAGVCWGIVCLLLDKNKSNFSTST